MTTTAYATPDREPQPDRLAKGRALADAAWGRTLDALNGEGGVAPHLRAEPVPVCVQTTRARIRHDGTEETGRTVHRRARPDWDTWTGREEWPPVTPPVLIESDALDRAQEARLEREDDARAAYWHGDRDDDYEWSRL